MNDKECLLEIAELLFDGELKGLSTNVHNYLYDKYHIRWLVKESIGNKGNTSHKLYIKELIVRDINNIKKRVDEGNITINDVDVHASNYDADNKEKQYVGFEDYFNNLDKAILVHNTDAYKEGIKELRISRSSYFNYLNELKERGLHPYHKPSKK